MSIGQFFPWKITKLFFILGTISHSEQKDATCQKYFQKRGQGGEILNNDVLFSHSVASELFCGELCLREFSCTGFNYMARGNQSEVNCQITGSAGGLYTNINEATTWEFYQTVKTVETCPDGWHQSSSSCYYVSKTKTSYTDAISACHSMGADLFLPLTEEETQTTRSFLTNAQHRYWIDLKLDPNTRKFRTASGKHPTYTKWERDEPNNLPSENCVQFKPFNGGFWNNIRCSKEMYYICAMRC